MKTELLTLILLFILFANIFIWYKAGYYKGLIEGLKRGDRELTKIINKK